jgi:ActR/RegA family two-component response regulator
MKSRVFILDDEAHIRSDLSKYIKKEGYIVFAAATLEEANKIIQVEDFDIAVIDLKIDYHSDYSGIKVIENVNKLRPRAKVIVLSAYEQTSEIRNELKKVYYDSYVPKGGSANYIKAVVEQLSQLKDMPPEKTCFVIMPFSTTKTCTNDQWTEIFETMIKTAVETSGYHYECFRACLDIGNIIKDILVNLNRADVVIADLTDKNPNVFYELGVRHTLRNATILITQDINHVPFDLRHYALIEYDWTTRKGRNEFNIRIAKILKSIEEEGDNQNITSPVREYLKL